MTLTNEEVIALCKLLEMQYIPTDNPITINVVRKIFRNAVEIDIKRRRKILETLGTLNET